MLTHGIARTDRLITDYLGSRGTLLEEFPLFDDPAVPIDLNCFLFRLPVRVPRPPLHGHGIAPTALQDDFITDLRLRQGFHDRAFDVLAPNLTMDRRASEAARNRKDPRLGRGGRRPGRDPASFPTMRSRELP